MSRATRAFLLLLAAAAAVAYGLLDVRRRSGLDPASESEWRRTLAKVETPSVARHRTDATVYLAAALALERGEDPYRAQSPRGWRYVYPPLFALLLVPLARLPVADAAFVLYLVSALALGASAWLLVRILGPPRGMKAVALALLVAAPFLVQTFQRGQVTILLLLTQVGSLALLLKRRDFSAGIVLALGIALRLTPALVAGMVGVACLVQLLRPGERLAALRFPAGLAAGIALGFALVPAAFLGTDRAASVTADWLESSRRLYAPSAGDRADLGAEYEIDEWSFKNQSVRRVAADALSLGSAREEAAREAEAGSPSPELVVADLLGFCAALASVVLGTIYAAARLRDRAAPSFVRVFALGVLLPVFVTRYAWPTHYVAAIPFLAACLAGRRRPWGLACAAFLAAGVLLFYVGHLPGWHAFPRAGVLLLAAALSVAIALDREAGESPGDEAVLDRWPDSSWGRAAYRRARLRHGGLRRLAGFLPREGTIVDLGAGEGLFAHVLVDESPSRRVVAVDHDGARVARLVASAEGLPIEAVSASMESVPLPPCDGVAAIDVLHYLDGSAQEALLARAFAALKPGGVLVMRDPDAGGGLRFWITRLHERIATSLGFTKARIGRYRSSDDWASALRAAGFGGLDVAFWRFLSPYADRTIVARKAP